jgi:hypothetical protein
MQAAPATPPPARDVGNAVEPSKPVGSPVKVLVSSTPTPSPRLSTPKKKGMELLAGMVCNSSNIWEDKDDSAPLVTPTKVSRADRLGTLRSPLSEIKGPKSQEQGLKVSPSTPSKDKDKEDLLGYYESLNMYPYKTIGKSVMRGHNASLARSLRSSPTRSVLGSPEKSVTSSPSRGAAGSPLKSAMGASPSGTNTEERVKENKSIWDADDDEFENWPTQQT